MGKGMKRKSVNEKMLQGTLSFVFFTKLIRVWLAGSTCDSDDKYTAGGHYILLPSTENLETGQYQYLAVFDTGAYQDALSSHHCLLSSPAKNYRSKRYSGSGSAPRNAGRGRKAIWMVVIYAKIH